MEFVGIKVNEVDAPPAGNVLNLASLSAVRSDSAIQQSVVSPISHPRFRDAGRCTPLAGEAFDHEVPLIAPR